MLHCNYSSTDYAAQELSVILSSCDDNGDVPNANNPRFHPHTMFRMPSTLPSTIADNKQPILRQLQLQHLGSIIFIRRLPTLNNKSMSESREGRFHRQHDRSERRDRNNKLEIERRLATTIDVRIGRGPIPSSKTTTTKPAVRRRRKLLYNNTAERRLSHPESTSKGVRAPTYKGVPSIHLQR